MFSGYIQIQKKGYSDNPTLNKAYKLTPEIKTLLDNNEHIISYAPRIMGNGLISFKDNTFGILLVGIDPARELKTSKLKGRIKAGVFLSGNSENEIILGGKLLKNLKANIGDTLVVLATGADGSMGNLKFIIKGTYVLGSPDFDASSAMINLQAANELFSMRNKIHITALKLDDLKSIEPVVNYFNENTSDTTLVALGWDKVLPALKQSIDLDNISGLIFQFLLSVVIAFGILNTVLMSINERYKEFGILLAVGIKNSKLILVVFLEILLLIAIGIILGNVIAHSINYYYYNNPIYVTGNMAEIYELFGFLPAFYFSISPDLYINTSLRVLIISLVTFVYPAYKLWHLEPMKGIRYT
jgi:ABC-type lipoprotein release transport system permease subunit